MKNFFIGNGGFFRDNAARFGFFCILAFAAAVLASAWERLYFGVDFTDEAYYAATPWHFLSGGRPFIDESLIFMQFPSLITENILKLYLLVTGGIDGIIIFLRQAYFSVQLLVGLAVFFVSRRMVSWPVALALALVPVAFIPWNIPALSYNSMGADLFLVGCLAAFWSMDSQKRASWMFLPGIIHGLAALVYPTLPIPAACMAATLFFWRPKNFRRAVFYVFGVALVGVAAAPFIFQAGLGGVKESFDYTQTIGRVGETKLGGLDKVKTVLNDGWDGFGNNFAAVIIFCGIFLGLAKKPKLFHISLLYFPLLVFALFLPGKGYVNMGYVSYCALALVPLLIFWKDVRVRRLFGFVAAPSLIAGAVMAWSSDNGFVVSSLGFLGVCIAGLIVADMAYVEFGGSNRVEWQRAISPALFVSVLMVLQYSFVFKDGQISELTQRVESGPYKGLLTSGAKNSFLSGFSKDVNAVAGPNSKILVYSHFPAGYLIAKALPATNNSWLFSPFLYPKADNKATVDYYNKNNIRPDIIVIMKKIPVSAGFSLVPGYLPTDPIIGYIGEKGYHLVLSTGNYDIYDTVK